MNLPEMLLDQFRLLSQKVFQGTPEEPSPGCLQVQLPPGQTLKVECLQGTFHWTRNSLSGRGPVESHLYLIHHSASESIFSRDLIWHPTHPRETLGGKSLVYRFFPLQPEGRFISLAQRHPVLSEALKGEGLQISWYYGSPEALELYRRTYPYHLPSPLYAFLHLESQDIPIYGYMFTLYDPEVLNDES